MDILANGVDADTGQPFFEPLDDAAFGAAIYRNLEQTGEALLTQRRATDAAATYRSRDIERPAVRDETNPRSVGWTFLVREDDPHRDAIVRALQPLAKHRGMANPERPLLWQGACADEWTRWLDERYAASFDDDRPAPRYVLIVGGPTAVSFHFQAALSSLAYVGRVDFENVDDLSAYAKRVVTLEESSEPVVERSTLFFAPDGGVVDATYYSRRDMAQPLADYVQTRPGMTVRRLFDEEATKARLLESIRAERPALLYTASHGMGVRRDDEPRRRALNGAICCQPDGLPLMDRTLAAADIPLNEPFVEGGVFFQFACFGYGTPAVSDFAHWTPLAPPRNAADDFIAALPQRVLAHPRGPIAYVGHVDLAWLQGFRNPTSPVEEPRVRSRLQPFKYAVNQLLRGCPVGFAMDAMSERYTNGNRVFADTYEDMQRKIQRADADFMTRLTDIFIRRNDAQNYLILGDPGARVQMPAA